MPVTISLWGFQREDVEKLRQQTGALLLNDMGTGKTVEAVERDRLLRLDRPSFDKPLTLVVTKMVITEHWERHFNLMTPDLNISVFRNDKDRDEFYDALKNHTHDVYVLYWQCLRKPPVSEHARSTWAQRVLVPLLLKTQWFHIIADEAHRASNRKSQQAYVLKRLKTRFKTAVTGTPFDKPPQMWSVLNWLYPKSYRSFWKFFESYVQYTVVPPLNYKQIIGVKNTEELRNGYNSFTVRRRKRDVLKDLPDRYYTSVVVDLDPKQRRAYNAMRDSLVAWIGEREDEILVASAIIAQLQRLQQFAIAHAEIAKSGALDLREPSSKLDAVQDILEDAPGEQFVIFSQFRGAVRLLETRLRGFGESFSTLTGDTPNHVRGSVVGDFQAGRVRIFAGTIGAGGEGIDLFASNKVIFLDRSWSPADNDQAESRLHRAGQRSAVQVIHIMARDTIDAVKAEKIQMKAKWFKQMLGDDRKLIQTDIKAMQQDAVQTALDIFGVEGP
jgi:SNF2 family DNA or RNA helicase